MSSALASGSNARQILWRSRNKRLLRQLSLVESRNEMSTSPVVSALHLHSTGKHVARELGGPSGASSVSYSRLTLPNTFGSRSYASGKAHGKTTSASSHPIPVSPGKSTRPNALASSSSAPSPDQPFPAPYHHRRPAPPPRSPITKWVLASPSRTAFFLRLGDWLGYGSPKQMAAVRAKVLYDICSEVAGGAERPFWYDTLSLPPSFQSWFTVTNLHVWLMTVRLRALPAPHGRPFIQALIDHFFFDVEDRVRAVLGKKAPERLVTRHMKILREQWGGLGLAFDHALITGDKDMASAVWRNLLGARGAQGIAYPEPAESLDSTPLPSSEKFNSLSSDPRPPEDASGGVADFEGGDVNKYVHYPQLMLILVGYLRRELVRLEDVSDASILSGVGRGLRGSVPGPEAGTEATKNLRDVIKFGRVRDAARKVGADSGIF